MKLNANLMTPKDRTCWSQSYQSIGNRIKGIHFTRHATDSGFRQRKEQKLSGKLLLTSFFLMALQGHNSFHLWAEKINLISGRSVSKQAIWKRMSDAYVKFLTAVLTQALGTQLKTAGSILKTSYLKKRYKRILIQDSTCISLPSCLCWCFPGNTSKGERKAVLKIQVVFDLLNNHFVYFDITPFTANDQSQSKYILFIAQPGDLLIRDLGYFSLDCFNQLSQANIHFVTRLKYGVQITDPGTGKKINLLNVLRKQRQFDRWVCLGSDTKLCARLVALPLPQEQASLKRHKAKHDRDQRLAHTKEYYEQLGYSIFITSETNERFSTMQIPALYRLRWRIETIFKCWKSHFNFQLLIPNNLSMTRQTAEAIIHMMLIFCLLFQLTTYNYLLAQGCTCISITKLCRYLANNFTMIAQQNIRILSPKLIRYCSYEKRKDRRNYYQTLSLS
jgi:hypothetical protein